MKIEAKTEKRFSFIVNILYFAIIIVALYLVIKECFWIIAPFVIAFIVAAMLQKPISFIQRKIKVPRGLLSTIGVFILLGLIGGFVAIIGVRIVAELKDVINYLTARIQDIPQLLGDVENWLLSAISILPASIEETLAQSITSFLDDVIANGFSSNAIGSLDFDWSSLISTGGGVLVNTIGQLPSLLIGIVVTIVACVFMTTDYDTVMGFFLRQLSEGRAKQMVEAKHICFTTARKMIKAYAIIIIITTTELSIALSILSLLKVYTSGHIFIIALIIAIIDIIPVLGTGTVLIPWSVISILSGHVGLGVGLLITYAAITVIRQVLEPKLVAGQVGLPPIVTIIAMYIGTKTLGVFGFFLLPFIVILIKSLNDSDVIHIFKKAPVSQPEQPEKETKTDTESVKEDLPETRYSDTSSINNDSESEKLDLPENSNA